MNSFTDHNPYRAGAAASRRVLGTPLAAPQNHLHRGHGAVPPKEGTLLEQEQDALTLEIARLRRLLERFDEMYPDPGKPPSADLRPHTPQQPEVP